MKTKIIYLYSFTLIFLTLSAGLALSAQRVALVIGNGGYKSSPLKNPVNDADDVSSVLKSIGFNKVIKVTDASLREMEDALNEFSQQLKRGDVALFFYAGHGVQIDGINYLVPVGNRIRSARDVKYMAFNVGMALDRMDEAKTTNIIILDACRDNPLGRGISRSVKRGLAVVTNKPKGSIIVYATSEGKTAADGKGRNGLFTSALLKYIRKPELEINTLFRSVGKEVQQLSRGKQLPWSESSIYEDFYLASRAEGSRYTPQKVTPDLIALPKESQTSFDDILKAAAAKEKAVAKWKQWQTDRDGEYAKAKQIDNNTYLTPQQKKEAWKRFLASTVQDNPYSNADNEMRSYCRSRMDHWEKYSPEPEKQHKQYTPAVSQPKPNADIVSQEGYYVAYAGGVVYDKNTGLEWYAGPDKNTNWSEAKRWAENLTVAGGGWRMPTKSELKALYKKGEGSRNMTPLLKTSGWYVWSDETRDSSSACIFDFGFGFESWYYRTTSKNGRGFAVRSR